jgi:hypothetical protein
MPHLSELQHEYSDKVTFIGVTRENAETVDGFLAKEQSAGKTWREVVQYRLALDDSDVTNTAYMRAAGQSGIPTAFIVGKDGRIEWIGHPMTMDEPLAKIVAGEWDREAAIAEFKKGQVFKLAVREISTLARAKEWDAALEQITALEAELPDDARIVQLRMAVFRMAGRVEELHAIEGEYLKQIWDSSNDLNDYAWGQCLQPKDRNLALALKAAQRGVELTEEKDAPLLDTLARVHFELGDVKSALAWQKKAVAINSDNEEIAAALQRYEAAAAKPAETEATN